MKSPKKRTRIAFDIKFVNKRKMYKIKVINYNRPTHIFFLRTRVLEHREKKMRLYQIQALIIILYGTKFKINGKILFMV